MAAKGVRPVRRRSREYARAQLALISGPLQTFPASDVVADEAQSPSPLWLPWFPEAATDKEVLKEARLSAAIREGVSVRHPNDVFRRRLLMIEYGHVGDHLGSPFITAEGDPKAAKVYFDKCVAIARGIVRDDPQDRTARYDLANDLPSPRGIRPT